MKLLFMGTPEIAAHCLEALLQEGKHEICGVYTREDKPVGRKQVMTAPLVKQVAMAHGLAVFQPKTLRDGQAAQQIATLAPEVIVVVAYGRILPQEVLDLPRYGAINLHVSLLPQYRGAAPVQWAIINGETETGVTIMQLDAGMDTGAILCQQRIAIGENETAGELFEHVTATGAHLLCETMAGIEAGIFIPLAQDPTKATLAPPLRKEQALLDFTKPAEVLHNLARGMNPWPMAYFVQDAKKIKVLRSTVSASQNAVAGEILALKPLTIACQTGALILHEVVPEGSRPMEGSAWAIGRRFTVGDCLQQKNSL